MRRFPLFQEAEKQYFLLAFFHQQLNHPIRVPRVPSVPIIWSAITGNNKTYRNPFGFLIIVMNPDVNIGPGRNPVSFFIFSETTYTQSVLKIELITTKPITQK